MTGARSEDDTATLSQPDAAPQRIWAPYLALMALATAAYVLGERCGDRRGCTAAWSST